MSEWHYAKLAGRCTDGFQRDGGRLHHVIPGPSPRDLHHRRALCGAQPGRRSVGFSPVDMRDGSGQETARVCGRCRQRLERAGPAGPDLTREEIRRRLLRAGRHLTPPLFGYAVSASATPGCDWGGSSKGAAIDAVADALLGVDSLLVRFRTKRGFSLEDVEDELRRTAPATPRRRGVRA